jgi:exonuclease SbcC
MKLFSRFRRPLWEHPEANHRIEAVRSETAPELIAALPQIAATDSAAEVRRAAIARIDSADALLNLLASEKDSSCIEAIVSRVRARLLDPKSPVEERQRLAAHPKLPADLQEAVAESAPEVALREAALARINKPGLLQRRCLKDPDAGLRLRLLERIEDEATLERIADAARGQDKNLSRRAREKLDALKLARGDAGAINHRALALGGSFDALARALPADAQAQLDVLLAEVEQLAAKLDAALLRRLQGHADAARAAVSALLGAHLPKPIARPVAAEPAADIATAESATTDASIAGNIDTTADTQVGDDATSVDLSAIEPTGAEITATDAASMDAPMATPLPGAVVAAVVTEPTAKREPAAPDEALREALKRGLAGVEDQRLGVARPALDAVRARLATGIRATPSQREQQRALEAGVAEMERWQRWAGNKVRARLCDEVEALLGAGMHPDALANRLKELQDEWAKVEAAEPDHGEHATGIAKRFRALCNRAIAPARPYFEQRRTLRSQKATELEAVVTALDAEFEQAPEDLKPLRERVVEALRALDEVDPRSRSTLGKRLRAQLAKVDEIRDARRAEAVAAKRELLERLRFAARGDSARAIETAKAIQNEWKTAPRADRKTEDKLWAELRDLVDPLFEAVRADAHARSAGFAAAEAERRALLEAVQALGVEGDLAQADAQLAELEARWQAQQPAREEAAEDPRRGARDARSPRGRDDARSGGGRDDRGERRPPRPARAAEGSIEREFEKAIERVRAAQKAQRDQRSRNALANLAAAALDASKDEQLSESERRELGNARARSVDAEAREDALIRLELEAGIDSPSEAVARRRELQMQRLAERMGGAANAAEATPRAQLLAWAAFAVDASAAQNARAGRAFEALLKS